MSKRKFLFFLVLLIIGACHNQSSFPRSGKYIKINLGSDPSTLDPRLARDPNSHVLMRMFFEGLTRIGPDEEPKLALAKNYEISEDLKKYTFRLRSAKWSNGDPIRSHDFAYAFKKTLSPEFPSDTSFQLFCIKNAKLVKEGKKSLEDLGIYTPDEMTLVIELEYPVPYFLELLSTPYFFPIHEITDRAYPNWARQVDSYVSNGPFLLKNWRHHDLIIAEKNPNYWDADQVQIDGICLTMVDVDVEMKLFEKGKLDWIGSPLSEIPVDSITHLKEDLIVKPRDETAFLRINVEESPLSHPKIRKALALAINREDLVRYVTQGGQIPAFSLIPPSMKLQKKPYFEEGNLLNAQLLLQEGLAELQVGQFPRIKLIYINKERSHLIAQALQQQWYSKLAIWVDLEAVEQKVFFDRISHSDFELAFCSWGADFHDPINFLEVFKYRSSSTNNTNWESEDYAESLDASYQVSDRSERNKILHRCEKILMDSMPIIPLFHYTMLYRKTGQVEGVFLSSIGNLDFKWARLENDQ